MPSPFSEIVREERMDRMAPRERSIHARSLMMLAHRMRTNTLTYRPPTKWQRFVYRLRKFLGI